MSRVVLEEMPEGSADVCELIEEVATLVPFEEAFELSLVAVKE